MTDAEILAAMRAKKAEAETIHAELEILRNEEHRLVEDEHKLWFEIRRLHNALLYPDLTL